MAETRSQTLTRYHTMRVAALADAPGPSRPEDGSGEGNGMLCARSSITLRWRYASKRQYREMHGRLHGGSFDDVDRATSIRPALREIAGKQLTY